MVIAYTRIHARTFIHVRHTLVPVTRESWRIGIFSAHQRGTLKNGTRILFTVSREERASIFDTERNGRWRSGSRKRCQTSVLERKRRRGKRLGRRTYPADGIRERYIYIYFSPHDFRFDDFRFVPISLLRYQSLFTLYFSNVNRDVALLGFSRRRGQIDQSPVAMPLPNVQLLVLHRSESDRDLRPGWAGVHQRQAKRAERLVEPELRRQSRAQRHDQDR